MGTDAKKRTVIKVLLIVFSILAFTGFGIILQTFLRQTGEIKKVQQTAMPIQKNIDIEKERLTSLKKKAKVLKTQITEAEKKSEEVMQAANLDTLPELQAQIMDYLQDKSGIWSVYVKNLSTQEAMLYNDQELKGASLLKLYIMGAVYDQIKKGNLEKDENIALLLNDMITVSDNSAANQLVQILGKNQGFAAGATVVNEYISKNGYTSTELGHDFQSERTEIPETENMTSVLDCGSLLEKIYNGSAVSQEASQEMKAYLEKQTRKEKIPAGLPADVVCANKTGEINGTENDAAIITADNGITYILCVMTQEVDNDSACMTIKELSAMVYNYFTETSSEAE